MITKSKIFPSIFMYLGSLIHNRCTGGCSDTLHRVRNQLSFILTYRFFLTFNLSEELVKNWPYSGLKTPRNTIMVPIHSSLNQRFNKELFQMTLKRIAEYYIEFTSSIITQKAVKLL